MFPSYARGARQFRQEIGTDVNLLDLRKTLIEQHLEKTSWQAAAFWHGPWPFRGRGRPGRRRTRPDFGFAHTRVDGWKEVDARAVVTFIRAQREAHPGAELRAALEKVGALPGYSGFSAFRFGRQLGAGTR